jgi:CubicO group peptidase (beta-lactamase class C family)
MTARQALQAHLRRAVREGLEKRLFTSAVIRIEQNSSLICEIAEGNAAVIPDCRGAPQYIPASPQTLFDIASLTKLFTTTALLRLVTIGKASLHMRAAEALPEPLASQIRMLEGPPVTLQALLTHSSGFHAWYPFYACREILFGKEQPGASMSAGSTETAFCIRHGIPSDFVLCFEEFLRRFPRKNEMIYSDINFILAGMVASYLYGTNLEQAIQRLVLEPLGLASTGFRPFGDPRMCRRAFAPTEYGNRIEEEMVSALGMRFSAWRSRDRAIIGEVNDGNCWYYFGGASGHAGLFSTAENLCRLGNLYIAGVDAHSDYLDSQLAALATTDLGSGRGLGFQFGPRYPYGCGHTGFTGTMLALIPASRICVAVMTNRLACLPPPNIDPFRHAIMDSVLNLV